MSLCRREFPLQVVEMKCFRHHGRAAPITLSGRSTLCQACTCLLTCGHLREKAGYNHKLPRDIQLNQFYDLSEPYLDVPSSIRGNLPSRTIGWEFGLAP